MPPNSFMVIMRDTITETHNLAIRDNLSKRMSLSTNVVNGIFAGATVLIVALILILGMLARRFRNKAKEEAKMKSGADKEYLARRRSVYSLSLMMEAGDEKDTGTPRFERGRSVYSMNTMSQSAPGTGNNTPSDPRRRSVHSMTLLSDTGILNPAGNDKDNAAKKEERVEKVNGTEKEAQPAGTTTSDKIVDAEKVTLPEIVTKSEIVVGSEKGTSFEREADAYFGKPEQAKMVQIRSSRNFGDSSATINKIEEFDSAKRQSIKAGGSNSSKENSIKVQKSEPIKASDSKPAKPAPAKSNENDATKTAKENAVDAETAQALASPFARAAERLKQWNASNGKQDDTAKKAGNGEEKS
ncbi:hypothetical protein BS50DRAFT_577768 [Corynespora cassiicola Philippines]|uniref:Uncharacterized protein n=1 Tax=Corynespora cassiicola Philippines TaxID=1448308 RepID=A0A2T2NBQ5_CORCC|nr:hypothetical protein BS50DRAFT_577768 [Corynespora cassiicola Philippines]